VRTGLPPIHAAHEKVPLKPIVNRFQAKLTTSLDRQANRREMPKIGEGAIGAKKPLNNRSTVAVMPGGWPNSAQLCLFLAPIGLLPTIAMGQR
jgi:hypothetical protein